LSSILVTAKSGQWDAAQKQVFALSEAQRPTADDLARLREQKTTYPKK
jgi:hypothetical protein